MYVSVVLTHNYSQNVWQEADGCTARETNGCIYVDFSLLDIKPQGFARKKGGLIKVDCKAGRLWLPYRGKKNAFELI